MMMYRWTAITLSVIAILALSACGGWGSTADNTNKEDTNISTPIDNTDIADTNISTPADNRDTLIDLALSCSISEVNITIESLIANIKCEDKDGINSATAKIKSDNGTTQAITLADGDTSFDKNITFMGLDNNTTYTIEASISSTDGKLEEILTQTVDYNITTLAIDTPITDTKDTQAPTLSSTSQTFTSTVGEEIILETVTASDNIDSIVTVVQSGDSVDNNTVGTYEVVYTATDTAWNSSSIIHTYNVTEVPNTAPIAIDWIVQWAGLPSQPFSMADFISDTQDIDSTLKINIITFPSMWTLIMNWIDWTYTMSPWKAWSDYFEYQVEDTKWLKSEIKKVDLSNFDNV